MTVEQPAFGGRRHIGELVPAARPVAVFFGQCRESEEAAHGDALLRGRHRRLFRRLRPERLSRWRRPHPARLHGLVSGVLHSPGDGGTGALRAPFNAETF